MVARWSADNRPTFWRFFHHDIGRRSPDHRASIGRRSPDGRSITIYQRTVGRQTPDIGRHTADNRPTVGRSKTLVCVILFTMHVSTIIIKYILHLLYLGIHFIWPRVQVTSGFCVGFPIELFVWHFEINISTTSKRLQPNSGNSLIYDDCNLKLNILLLTWIELSLWSFEIKVSTGCPERKFTLIYIKNFDLILSIFNKILHTYTTNMQVFLIAQFI